MASSSTKMDLQSIHKMPSMKGLASYFFFESPLATHLSTNHESEKLRLRQKGGWQPCEGGGREKRHVYQAGCSLPVSIRDPV